MLAGEGCERRWEEGVLRLMICIGRVWALGCGLVDGGILDVVGCRYREGARKVILVVLWAALRVCNIRLF